MKLETRHYIGMGVALALIILDIVLFRQSKAFFFFIGISVIVGIIPFIATVMIESGREKEKEEMFLEFSRNLVESVRAGTPISKSILNVRGKKYGTLSPHIDKLANQIALGIPVRQAFHVFARDINNRVITRSIALITEAEESGGRIDDILEKVALSVSQVEDIEKERKSSMYNTVVQLYIIFIIFLVIMIVLQVKFIPKMMTTLTEVGAGGAGLGTFMGVGGGGATTSSQSVINTLFLVLILIQGLFAGLVIGKLSEGAIKAGIKHSAIIIAIAFLITEGMKAFMSSAPAAAGA